MRRHEHQLARMIEANASGDTTVARNWAGAADLFWGDDPHTAAAMLEHLAANDVARTQEALYKRYLKGENVPQDIAKARERLFAQANLGEVQAMIKNRALGICEVDFLSH